MKKRTRKFDGHVFNIVSEGWSTRKHALQSTGSGFSDKYYIRFTLEGDYWVMWARPKKKPSRKR